MQTETVPMAIIGVSGRYPKSDNLDQLWVNLKSGLDCIGEAKGDRWDLGFHGTDRDQPQRIYTKAGGFLDRIDLFDADFFGMSPREAKQVDPQHRLLLELAWEAFESAGIVPSDVAGSRTGVFVGISSTDYSNLATDRADAYTNIGSSLAIAANRISYVYDLHGPSLSIDTACSSSIVALHQACTSLAAGETAMALVGGVNLLMGVKPWIGFSRASMLSPDGRCKSFDASGNGYVRSEGGGMVIVKRLSDAERDGDAILGVILATGVNSDGRTMGMALPSGEAQERLLREVYGRCGLSPEQVFYVEAHGTGTAAGDPIECGAIGRVLGSPRADGSTCLIGSVKSNIGHLEPGAGIAGLTKVLLSLRHGEIPANLHFETPNPKIDFEGWKLSVVDKAVPLPRDGAPLIFGLNSFGFGGTNAHVVIQEYRKTEDRQAAPEEAPEAGTFAGGTFAGGTFAGGTWDRLLMISGHTPEALKAVAGDYARMLRTAPDAEWRRICATAALARGRHAHRLALMAETPARAAETLDRFLAGEKPPGLATGRAGAKARRLAFVYSGNGPQWWGMGRELLAQNPVFRAEVEAVDALFAPLAGWSLIAEMAKPESESRIALTEIGQPLLFALQMGLTAVLREAGLQPAAVFGHSVGEVAAAAASGALTREQAVAVIFHRSSLQAQTAGRGRMAAISLSAAEATEAMAATGGWLEIAAVNARQAVTVAGDPAALETLVDRLTDEGHFARLLQIDYPFHTSAMDSIQASLLLQLQGLAPGAATVPFVSTVEGTILDGTALDAGYWWRNVRAPVKFADAAEHALAEQGIEAFIEIGPHPVLVDYLNQAIKASQGSAATAFGTLRRPTRGKVTPEDEAVTNAVCAAYAAGAGTPEAIFRRPAILAELPSYPWMRERHWRGGCELPASPIIVERDHELLGHRLPGGDGVWNNLIQTTLLPYLNDHVVQGTPLFPAAGYIELSLAAGRMVHGGAALALETFDILRPLTLPEGVEPMVETCLDAADGTLRIRSRPDAAAPEWTDHVKGRVTKLPDGDGVRSLDRAALLAGMPAVLDAAAHYAGCHRRGMSYGPAFQGVISVAMTEPGEARRAALGEVALPALDGALSGYHAHPALLDSCLQVLVSLIGQCEPRDCATIPVQVDRILSLAPLPARILCHVALRHESARSGLADITVADTDGRVVMVLEGARFQKVEFRSSVLPILAEDWRPDPAWTPRHPTALFLPAPGDLAATLAPALGKLHETAPTEARAAVEAVAAAQVAAVLDGVQGGLDANGEALLSRLVARVEAAGTPARAGQDADALWRAAMLAHPQVGAELVAVARAAEQLPARLRGAGETPVAMLESLEDTAPTRAGFNRFVADALAAAVAAWPAGRPVRVVETNGGTGGLAAALLPVLPPERSDYLFLDAAEQTVGRAQSRFSGHHFFRADTKALGDLPRGAADIVVVNGAFDARDLSGALAPGGLAFVVAPGQGLMETLLFPEAEALDAEAALAGLGLAGFETGTPLGAEPGPFLVLARRPASDAVPDTAGAVAGGGAARLLLVGEAEAGSAFVARAAAALAAAGQAVRTRTLTAADLNDEAMAALVAEESDVGEVVHLAGWAATPEEAADILAGQDLRCLSTILLARAIEARAVEVADYAPVLTLVTRHASAGPDAREAVDPFQAPLRGLGRVIANEQPSLGVRLIDVHAAADDGQAGEDIAAALLRRDAETETLLRDGLRFVSRARLSSGAEQARIARPSAAGAPPQAFRLDFRPGGGLDSLHLRGIERREPGPGEIEIAVKAAGLNFRDVLWAMGVLPEEAVEKGFSGPTIGMECAGEVVRVGPGVTTHAVGDRVIAFASSCFASHVTTSAGSAAPMPAGLSHEAAATIPTAFVTAWYALDHLARLEPGETVLIHGAAGGVGLAALQIAKLRGAIVFASAGSADKQRLVRTMGADHVVSSRSLAFADDIMRLTGGRGVDVVLNSLAGEAITKGLQVLKPFGRFLEIGKRDLYANNRIGLRPFRQNLSYFGIDADTLLVERPDLARRVFEAVLAAMARGDLRPLPHQAIPVSRAVEAFRAMQQSRHIGKLVVSMETGAAAMPVVPAAAGVIRPGVTYLVTGGLSGFGLATARWLVARGATSLALLGRRGGEGAEERAALAELAAGGAAIRAFAADVSDPAAVAAVLAEIRAAMAPLKGVFHAAALIEDAPLIKVDRGLLHRVMAAKVIGAFALDRLTREDGLETFVLYSSSSAVVGNPGQGCYVAANSYLDALAQSRRAEGLPALSVGWGAIKDAGFLTRNRAVQDMLASRTGMEATPVRDAFQELESLLAAEACRVSAAQFNLMRLGQMLAGARTPRFSGLVPQGVSMTVEGANSLAATLEALGEDERRALLLTRIPELIARVVGTNAAQIGPDRPLSELGLDSLMAVELAEGLEQDIGRPVSVMQIIQAGTVGGVVEVVLRGFRTKPADEAAPPIRQAA
ncbi:type I polyketide synthase [Methylobacterium nonmethylotrophicum]|nr:type I polyketide synthase [Methylobacterium nonmethylotrophicum]